MPRSLYSEAMADDICAEIALGRSLREICEIEPWAPAFRTVIEWLTKDVGDFRLRYARARETQADVHADDLVYIADRPQLGVIETDKFDKDGEPITEVRRADMIEHRKLRIGTRQWVAEKLRPKVYGARQMVEHSGTIGITDGKDQELVEEMMELLATGRLKLPGGVTLVEGEEEDDYSDIA